jgi:hypothetical protein
MVVRREAWRLIEDFEIRLGIVEDLGGRLREPNVLASGARKARMSTRMTPTNHSLLKYN